MSNAFTPRVIPTVAEVQKDIDCCKETLKRLNRLLKVSEETYGTESPAAPDTTEKPAAE